MQRTGSSAGARPDRGTPPRLAGLDGLRGLAALAVVCLHVWMYTDAHAPHSVLVDAVIGEFRVAVGLFFVLSGFLLARPWIAAARGERPRPRLGLFALRRLARIGPPTGWRWPARSCSWPAPVTDARRPPASCRSSPPSSRTRSPRRAASSTPRCGRWASRSPSTPRFRSSAGCSSARRAPAAPSARCCSASRWSPAASGGPTSASAGTGRRRRCGRCRPTCRCSRAASPAAVAVHGRALPRAAGAVLLSAGTILIVANGWWHAAGTGFWGHVITDLPGGIGFAAVVAAVASRPAGVLASAPLRALGALSYGLYLWHMPVLFALQLNHAFPPHATAALPRVLLPGAGAGRAELVAGRAAGPAVERAPGRHAATRGGARTGRLAPARTGRAARDGSRLSARRTAAPRPGGGLYNRLPSRARSSAERALASHARGRWFETSRAHHASRGSVSRRSCSLGEHGSRLAPEAPRRAAGTLGPCREWGNARGRVWVLPVARASTWRGGRSAARWPRSHGSAAARPCIRTV